MADGVLTVEQVAEKLGVTGRTVRNMIERRRFPHAYQLDPKMRKSPWRIPEADVESVLQMRQSASTEK